MGEESEKITTRIEADSFNADEYNKLLHMKMHEMHEVRSIYNGLSVIRVLGGFGYCTFDGCFFVPLIKDRFCPSC